MQNPNKDFLRPIILSNDKTTLSDIGDLHVDVIFLTSSLFNVEVSTEIKNIFFELTHHLYHFNVQNRLETKQKLGE